MALLKLKDIGKIYVSEGNVAVGIRGVNLTFEKGEFVAVTGKSGSGKSTLLNVISGMDSYEEGEMYVDGEPTSHFLQPEWEQYREDYISFIFQDYNIIESFTVLQNVELALMNIDNKKERRKRALELIDRVGLSSHVKHKGSKLSGGQKQRTVIARALAKDSPIILADEPTGNLDSVSSKEIIELLKEVSQDKLLLVVTHNFEQVQDYATRHIRIFDGEVESDQRLKATEKTEEQEQKKSVKLRPRGRDVKNGIALGKAIFTSKPRLSMFLCLLLILATLGVATITSTSDGALALFKKQYMFEPIDGRVVVVRRDGSAPTEEEIKGIAEKHGAESYLRIDELLDLGNNMTVSTQYLNEFKSFNVDFVYGIDYGDDIVGSYPTQKNEVLLYLPISYQSVFGKGSITNDKLNMFGVDMKVTGVKYYYDNNISPQCLFTAEGFKTATALNYVNDTCDGEIKLLTPNEGGTPKVHYLSVVPSFALSGDQVYFYSYSKEANYIPQSLTVNATYKKYDYYDNMSSFVSTDKYEKTYDSSDFVDSFDKPVDPSVMYDMCVYISADACEEIAHEVLNDSYVQFSLFFENDAKAQKAANELSGSEYIAVSATTATYTPELILVIFGIIAAFATVFVWVLTIIFLSFFVYLCSSRTLSAFKNDMAIMRSMGISVKVIQLGMYVRMLISLIPAYIVTLAASVIVYTSPKLNEYFMYLYPWQYAVIFVGMLLLTARTTRKQIKKLFGQSVKKSLKGGQAE